MNRERLLRLADLLEKDAENPEGVKFDMSEWGRVLDRTRPLSCGTTACAMGLAALSGEFTADGLDYEIGIVALLFTYNSKCMGGLDAAAGLFEIPDVIADRLFLGQWSGPCNGADGERRMAEVIRQYVETGVVPLRRD